jgi:intracellular multiplication protein IcmE
MADQGKSYGVGGRSGRFRTFLIFIIALVLVIGVMAFVYIQHQASGGIESKASLVAPPSIGSVPGEATTPEYARTVEAENVRLAEEAAKKGGSAIATIVRPSFSGSGDFENVEGVKPGCSQQDLSKARTAGVKAEELKCRGCSAKDLKEAGYTAAELLAAGYSPTELKTAGYSASELRAAGVSAAELLKAGFRPDEIAKAGFAACELVLAGAKPEALQAAGYTDQQLAEAGVGVKPSSDVPKDCNPVGLVRAKRAGVTAMELRKLSCGASALRTAGYSARELKTACYSAAELKAAGFTAAELKDAGFSAGELRAAGFSAKELKDAGYSATELRAAGFSAEDLHKAGFTADQMRAAGYTNGDLVRAGYTPQELIGTATGGGSVEDAMKLRAAGATAKELKDKGYDAKTLKAAGYTATELKAAGFSAEDLRKAGFTAEELKAAGFTAEELRKGGFTATELKKAGFTADQLRKAGFTVDELRAAGFTDAELLAAGFSAADLAGGDPCSDLALQMAKSRGMTSEQIRQYNCSAAQLRNAGFPRIDDAERRLTADQRRDLLDHTTTAMEANAANLFSAWAPPAGQVYVAAPVQRVAIASGDGGGNQKSGGAGGELSEAAALLKKPRGTIIKAGSILYATLDTAVNSDEKSPTLATIVSGPLKGSKLIGDFVLVGEAVELTFKTINIPQLTSSVPITAVAIDPDTARTALAHNVDNHYMLRYGSLFASSFLSGVASAISSAGSTSSSGAGGLAVTHNPLSNAEIVEVALGNVGTAYAANMGDNFKRLPTITIEGGAPIGVLITSDLNLPEKL